jgi:hypothetical protein
MLKKSEDNCLAKRKLTNCYNKTLNRLWVKYKLF